MASANIQWPYKRPWRRGTHSRRFFCCSCFCGEEKDPLQEQEKKINRDPQQLHLDKLGSGEKEPIQITVEDLGIVNSSFILSEEDPLTQRNSVARSLSSVSSCQRVQKKKRLKPLVSLPPQLQAEPAVTLTSREDGETEEEELLLFESGTDSTTASGTLLTPPVINLIPPTPSDVVDDDQFFDNNSEDSVAHTSGSDGSFPPSDQESCDEKMESVEAGDSKEGFTVADNEVVTDSASEPEKSPKDQLREEREAVPAKDGDKGKAKPRFLRGAYQVAPVPEYSHKSESNCISISAASLKFTPEVIL